MTDINTTTASEMTELCVAEWLDVYHKPERLNRERGTRDRLADLRISGSAIISRHDSVSGRVEFLVVR
ncbi:hypothetical protein [Mycobacteroides abscessus]|uniref:hypothetical protein n=1 Tax=Mycobacteroides abscessus TaxID=36809 RepID=UPI000925E986|nr:hypothetical protein [Mycobacteroides abscessus]MBN7333086.1 hypothetical protein [Mycobacteroides abscessus subsp. abscessus]SHP47769.1 Uncharacterised protein [Mycobacteroides abscessus subsp. abscessus]SIE06558.1 Uncharacterised protein [Mycobacteroides abscessus subsp. abscessus]SIE19377.1 Uncharacterised protein [Mycobacteroides abscessus subsp. abscessus]SIF97271.1 Uncharacterised protein [Mycobacteroides abscessus subsp. abscessus]